MKKTRRFLCLLLTLVLALSLCAIPAAAADDQTRSDDPVVFVHGLFGWGQRDKIFRIMPYWGMTTGSLPDYLATKGYETYAASVGPLSSAWVNDFELSALDRLSIVGNGGMGALTYEPTTSIQTGHEIEDFDLLQAKEIGRASCRERV